MNMSKNISQTNGPRETLEASESNILDQTLDQNRMTQIRQEIGLIADRSYRDKLINDEAYDGYRKLADGREEHEIGAEMLKSTREFAKGHEQKAIRINQKIKMAIEAGIASKADEEFLMEKLVTDNIQFASKSEEVEKLIEQKLTRMKKDRERYDKFADNKLIKDIGYLKVDGNTRINFPNAKEFLDMTVPQRRELLKKLEEALPKAEKYAKENESAEDKELTAGYENKLKGALKKGIIGKQTYDEFLNGFKKIDHEEKKYWNGEFDAQMERYETLWGQIRGSLEGEALENIESKIDSSGYTELFAEFGKLKNSENKRLNENYGSELEKYRKEGIIGRQTISQFAMWMDQQELPDKYKAEQKLPDQMVRYEKLWQDVEDIPEEQQGFMKSRIDVWGYTELNQQYLAFKGGADIPQVEPDDSDPNSLSQLKSIEVRDAIVETDEMLASQGKSKRSTFIKVLDKMFSKVGRNKFDANSFETQVRGRAANDNRVEQVEKGRGANDEVDMHKIKKDSEILEKTEGVQVTEDHGFTQVKSKDGDRSAQVTINKEGSMKRFFTEEGKHNYRAEEAGGNDDLSLAIKTDSGRTVELDLQEIQTLDKHLKKREKQEKLDKAA